MPPVNLWLVGFTENRPIAAIACSLMLDLMVVVCIATCVIICGVLCCRRKKKERIHELDPESQWPEIVYITPHGEKFHYSRSCRHVANTPNVRALAACKHCIKQKHP